MEKHTLTQIELFYKKFNEIFKTKFEEETEIIDYLRVFSQEKNFVSDYYVDVILKISKRVMTKMWKDDRENKTKWFKIYSLLFDLKLKIKNDIKIENMMLEIEE